MKISWIKNQINEISFEAKSVWLNFSFDVHSSTAEKINRLRMSLALISGY